ncbi:MAG: hypothetical protein PHG74_11625 [Kiritimatiellae bacterium]|nr:hypothetical protein [Kiritimatiellia bacterium]
MTSRLGQRATAGGRRQSAAHVGLRSRRGHPRLNPSGLFVGGSATFQITFSSNVRAEDVQWSVADGKAALAFGPQSTAPQIVVGLAPGTETLTANVAHFVGSSPQFNFEVYDYADPIALHFMLICDNNGNHAGSASDIPGLITGVNDIYRQEGLRFAQASVSYTNEISWYLNSEIRNIQQEIVNVMTNTGGLEIYIVPNIAPGVAGRSYPNQGLLMTNTVSAHILAHEIGHQCGWRDIYTFRPDRPPLTMPLSRDHLSPADWNNGPGPQEYYPRELPLATVIKRCLMFGLTSGGNDIPAGPIKGYDKEGKFGSVPVGTQGMNRFPKHDN